jgi:hypothetical protein
MTIDWKARAFNRSLPLVAASGPQHTLQRIGRQVSPNSAFTPTIV